MIFRHLPDTKKERPPEGGLSKEADMIQLIPKCKLRRQLPGAWT